MGKTSIPQPSLNKHRGPVTRTRQPEQNRVVAVRPNNSFVQWWDWALEQVDAARNNPPIRIHDEDRPVEGAQRNRWAIVVGWPFAAQFENYVFKGKRSAGPVSDTLDGLRNPRGNHPHEFRILWALLQGHTDPEVVRALVGGCHRPFFEAAAVRSFELVYDRIRVELDGVA